MTEPTPTSTPAPTPAPSPAPAPSPEPVAVARPEWLPETHWDTTSNAIKPEFGQHYAEVSNFHKTETERLAALNARKPEDIKIEVKLPDTVKVPEGFEVRINENDPRVPIIREMALKRGWDQDTVNDLVAFDAQMQIQAHDAEIARVAAEDAKLGANAKPRKEAVGNWLKGMKDRKELSNEEYEAVRIYATDAASITALEKIIAKASGSIPGGGSEQLQKPEQQSVTERWYGKTTPQQKAS